MTTPTTEQTTETKDTIDAAEIITYLLQNYETISGPPVIIPTNAFWSLADLFIRQYLNNGCDGFGCKNINVVYDYLYKNKDDLIKFNLISKDGYNNSGYPLWKNYSFEKPKSKEIEALCEELNEDIRAAADNWADGGDAMNKRKAIVEKFNKQWKETNEEREGVDDGEILRWNSNWIMDSEYMNFVYDDWASTRIQKYLKNRKLI